MTLTYFLNDTKLGEGGPIRLGEGGKKVWLGQDSLPNIAVTSGN
jgi:hypothetical protein